MPQDLLPIENLFYQAFNQHPSLAEAAHETTEEILKTSELDFKKYQACIEEIIDALETYGIKKHTQNDEPHYHNRQHTKEVLLSVSLLLSQENNNNLNKSKYDFSLWPPFSAHEKLLLLIAALGHDYLHPGGHNQKESEFELQSAIAIDDIMKKHVMPRLDCDIIRELILATEYHKVMEVHALGLQSLKAMPFLWRAKVILTEADICASALPGYGMKLSKKLADELKQANIKNSELLITPVGRRNFLRGIRFTSPHAKSLGLDKIVRDQLTYLEKELM
jgi:hypothetical protein